MAESNTPQWLNWAREIQSLGQIGLTFSKNEYDRQNYSRMLEIASEIVACKSEIPKKEILDNFLFQPGYTTPKIDIRAAVIQAGRILLVQEQSDQHWCMPGGWADVGEFPAEAVVRETQEESGFTVKPKKVVGVYDTNRGGRPMDFFHAYKIIFLCNLIDGQATPGHETIAVDFFSFDSLPPLSTNRTNERDLREVQKHILNTGRSTYFE